MDRVIPTSSRWIACALAGLAASVLVLGGCLPKFQLRLPATIEVVDGLTGLPVADATIEQGEYGENFRPGRHSRAITGPDGSARFVVMSFMDASLWQIYSPDFMRPKNFYEPGRYFHGRGFSQIPPEFTEIG